MPYFAYTVIITIGVLLLAVKVLFANKAFIRKNDLVFKLVILFIFLFVLGFHFYETELWTGIIVIGLTFLAIIKYLIDQKRDKGY